MFLRYYVAVDKPFEQIEKQLVEGARWMPDMAFAANGRGMELMSELGLPVDARPPGRRIKLELGRPRRTAGVTLLPLDWRVLGGAACLPVVSGQMEVARLGSSTTQVGASLDYEPPDGIELKISDRAMLHRVAEMTLKNFMERVGARLAHKAA
jgi:hypothetical protein